MYLLGSIILTQGTGGWSPSMKLQTKVFNIHVHQSTFHIENLKNLSENNWLHWLFPELILEVETANLNYLVWNVFPNLLFFLE